MIKEYLAKEMSDTLDRKLNIEANIRENFAKVEQNSEDAASLLKDIDSMEGIVHELDGKLEELQHVYDYIDKAEHYSYMEKYGINYPDLPDETSPMQMLAIQEEERRRIARDLHDSVVQKLTNIVHKVEFASRVMDKDMIKARLELKTIEKNTRDVISEMRDVIYNLRPMSFDDIGIETTVERELSRLQNISGIRFIYKTTGKPVKSDPVRELTIFRIIQEACSNCIRHSQATEISVIMHFKKKMISLEISDNGIGFDIDKVDSSHENDSRFGLSMMKERVYLLSGTIRFQSEINKGTKIFVDVPVS